MKLYLELEGIVACVCILTVYTAPTVPQQANIAPSGISSASKVADTETDLEKLARLTANKMRNVAIQNEKQFSYSNINGKENSVTQTEDKVFDSQNGKLVSDIKHKSEQDSSSGQPHESTKVDIPSLGIHETMSSDVNEELPRPEEILDYTDAFHFTPSVVAEYLVQSGEFREFDEALTDLVNSSLMTPQQAVTYKDNVRREYNRIVQENNALLANAPYYQVPYGIPADNLDDMNVAMDPDTSAGDIYRLYEYSSIIPHLGIEELQSKEVMREALTRASSLIELIKALMDEWLTRAIVSGDSDAEKLLGDILKEVSKDDDPDDLSQMRDILYEFFANEVLNSLQKRPEPVLPDLPIVDGDISSLPISQKQSDVTSNTKVDSVDNSDLMSTLQENKQTAEKNDRTEKNLKNMKM